MHFKLTETAYELDDVDNAEEAMVRHFRSQGYEVIHNGYAVLYRPRTTVYPDKDKKVCELFPAASLTALNHFYRTVYEPLVKTIGVNPGHLDLLVYRPDGSDISFCEVKKGGSDKLSTGQMIGISMIHVFLGSRIEVARVNGTPRSYEWSWPAFGAVHPAGQEPYPERELLLPIARSPLTQQVRSESACNPS